MNRPKEHRQHDEKKARGRFKTPIKVAQHANQFGHDTDFDHALWWKRLVITTRCILSKTEMRPLNISTFRIFTSHWRDLLCRAAFTRYISLA